MPALEQEVLDVIRRIFSTELEHEGPVELAHALQRDLRVDSLNAVILAVGLEDHFRVRLGQEDTVGVTTVAELVSRVAQRVRAARERPAE
jgi:acyl carrier protein